MVNLKRTDMQFLPFFINEEIYMIPETYNNSDNELIIKENVNNDSDGLENKSELSESNVKPMINKIKQSESPIVNLLVIIYEESDTSIILKEKLFLDKVLSAVKLNSDSVKIINIHSENNIDILTDVMDNLNITKAIAFGIPDNYISGSIKTYQKYEYNGILYTLCPSLTEIAQSRDEKLHLWGVLKKLFKT